MKIKKIISAVSAAALTLTAVTAISGASAADDVIFRDTFEAGENGWTGRGSASVEASGSNSFEGSRSLFVSGRESEWNGATKELDGNFLPGSEYSFSVNVMCPASNKENTFYLTLQYNDPEGEAHYDKIARGTSLGGDWIQLANTSYMIPADASDLYIYVETESGRSDFYIDDFAAAASGTVISGAGGGHGLILGDVTRDGRVDAFDVAAARMGYLTGFDSAAAEKNADADRSGVVELSDLVLISEFVLGKISEFPDNSPVIEEPEKIPFDYDPNLQFREAPGNYLNSCPQAGTITKEYYTGIRGNKALNVYTPYGYDPSKKYNIFYLMHGGGENEDTIFSSDVMLQNILDHMIMNNELEPLIVVTPTFNGNGSEAQNFYEEFRQSVIPFVEGKYSTYAESTDPDGIEASRMHRAYGGFSMGAVSTWAVMQNDLDCVGYFMPLSGDHWSGNSAQDKASSIAGAIDRSGYSKRQYFILAATGSDDIAYPNIQPQIEAMKPMPQFDYTSDFSQGNFYFMVAPGLTHWWGYVRHYVYDALPYFFHE